MRLLSLAPLLLIAACTVPISTPDSSDPTAPQPSVAGAPETSDPMLTGRTWTWVRTDEPATGEVMAPTEGAAEHVFAFTDDGRFVEDQLGGCCREEGDWSREGDTLTLAYDNGSTITWTDVSVSADQLTWTRIGRHGELVNVYRPR
jgi:hypothetical protein